MYRFLFTFHSKQCSPEALRLAVPRGFKKDYQWRHLFISTSLSAKRNARIVIFTAQPIRKNQPQIILKC